ncbi:MAG TPA: plastocyanin/azurin family copper-binding protein [Solirubrobacterales bacterium]|nr:plastocyanin/azurin family copper-binding protein [Solirubrobacterales bacterium]
MDDKDLFYIFGIALAVSAVLLTFAGLKLKNFPGRAFPVVILWFVALVIGATTFAVRESQHEAHAREAEHHAEESSSGPYENEGGALGGEREELEEQAEKEAEGTPGEEPVGETEGTSGGPEASSTLQLAADQEEIAFDKTELSAKAGKVTIDFDNPSAIPHNVVIEQEGEEIAGTPVITESKASVSADLEPGSYAFVCTVPGHEEAGMAGTLTVE